MYYEHTCWYSIYSTRSYLLVEFPSLSINQLRLSVYLRPVCSQHHHQTVASGTRVVEQSIQGVSGVLRHTGARPLAQESLRLVDEQKQSPDKSQNQYHGEAFRYLLWTLCSCKVMLLVL